MYLLAPTASAATGQSMNLIQRLFSPQLLQSWGAPTGHMFERGYPFACRVVNLGYKVININSCRFPLCSGHCLALLLHHVCAIWAQLVVSVLVMLRLLWLTDCCWLCLLYVGIYSCAFCHIRGCFQTVLHRQSFCVYHAYNSATQCPAALHAHSYKPVWCRGSCLPLWVHVLV